VRRSLRSTQRYDAVLAGLGEWQVHCSSFVGPVVHIRKDVDQALVAGTRHCGRPDGLTCHLRVCGPCHRAMCHDDNIPCKGGTCNSSWDLARRCVCTKPCIANSRRLVHGTNDCSLIVR
jgi:ribosomal protein S14